MNDDNAEGFGDLEGFNGENHGNDFEPPTTNALSNFGDGVTSDKNVLAPVQNAHTQSTNGLLSIAMESIFLAPVLQWIQ